MLRWQATPQISKWNKSYDGVITPGMYYNLDYTHASKKTNRYLPLFRPETLHQAH